MGVFDSLLGRRGMYCQCCGKPPAELRMDGRYAFCSDRCERDFGNKLLMSDEVTIFCPYCGAAQMRQAGKRTTGSRICTACHRDMDKLGQRR